MKSGNRKGVMAAAVLGAMASFGFVGAQSALRTPVEQQLGTRFMGGKYSNGRISRRTKRKQDQRIKRLSKRQRDAIKAKNNLNGVSGTLSVWTGDDVDRIRELRGAMGESGMRKVRRLTGGNRTSHALMFTRSNVSA